MRIFAIWFLILLGFAIPAVGPLFWLAAVWVAARVHRDFHAARRGKRWMDEESELLDIGRAFGGSR